MGQRFTLSFSDIKMANLAYNCDGIVQMGETIFNFLNIIIEFILSILKRNAPKLRYVKMRVS